MTSETGISNAVRPSTTNRRDFMRHTAALLAASGSLAPSLSQAQEAGEDYWLMVRKQFAFSENAVPMNAANLCPSFRAVTESMARHTVDIDFDCSFNNRAKYAELLESCRSSIAGQLGVSADEIALVRNTSEANNTINNGLQLEAGDEIVLWDQNHPTNNVAWEVRAQRFGLRIKRVSTPAAPRSPQELVESFTSQLNSNTRVLSITHVSNLSGIRLPVADIVAAARALIRDGVAASIENQVEHRAEGQDETEEQQGGVAHGRGGLGAGVLHGTPRDGAPFGRSFPSPDKPAPFCA